MTSGDVLRIGVAGAGNIASIAQLPTLVARDDVQLQGLVSRKDDPEPLMRRWGFRRAYPTVEALLEAEELDALFVLTPRSEHVHATRLALEAGVDVFCEKPLATRASDAQSLAELAAARERVLMVGFNRRFAPVYEAGRAAFGESGATFCLAQKNRASPMPRPAHRQPRRPQRRTRRLAGSRQRRPAAGPLALHHHRRPNPTPTPLPGLLDATHY